MPLRILFDECVPRPLRHSLRDHDVRTTVQMGWAGKRNGELLALAAAEFDVLLTADRRMRSQQVVSRYDLAVVVLLGHTNRLEDLEALVPLLIEALPTAAPGHVTEVGRRS